MFLTEDEVKRLIKISVRDL